MCLISRRKSPHTLKRDMRCWKVVFKSIDDGRLRSVYYGTNIEYRLGATHVERRKPDVEPDWGRIGTYDVGAGFVHAFSSIENAMLLRRQVDESLLGITFGTHYPKGRVAVVCECVIPAGTEVYSNRKQREVCARKMRFVKILS